jgi:dTMP kinase
MSSKGAFIVIEGSDGSGKTTQTELLATRLRKAGYTVETISFPRYDEPSSYFIQEYLAGHYGATAGVNPYTASLFYALDRFEAGQGIREALEEGRIVIANRYAGSNMAHQGAKFAHPDERRGFFIWLDSVEFQTMGIPRPDKSLILHVPTDVSAKLIDKRGLPKDEHERDAASLAKTTQVFAELCDLFPNDFVRLDCMRSGKLMSEDAVHAMIWATVEPLLPTAAELAAIAKTPAPKQHSSVKTDRRKHDAKTYETSLLLATKLRQAPEVPATPELYTPPALEGKIREQYENVLREILGLRHDILQAVSKYIQSVPKQRAANFGNNALSVIDLVVPFAALVTTTEPATPNRAATDPHEEAVPDKPSGDTHEPTIAELAVQYLPDNHAAVTPEPKLVSFWPRNELDLLPEMLYEYANVPIDTIRSNVAAWPIQRKQDALASYVRTAPLGSGSLLAGYHYTWDTLATYQTLQALTHMGAIVTPQTYTPRYGYDTPKTIEDAGASDQFERCFDLSLHLHSVLQAADLEQEAQYAVLLGHKQRYAVTVTADAFDARVSDPVISAMAEKLLEIHPVLHETKALTILRTSV